MEANSPSKAYQELRSFVKSISGTMDYFPGGGPGGVWEINIHGKTARVEVRDNRINDLDRLYISKVDNPKTWDDYDSDAKLVLDVFWKLVHFVDFMNS